MQYQNYNVSLVLVSTSTVVIPNHYRREKQFSTERASYPLSTSILTTNLN